ncbi:glycosyltransferase family 32 protein [Chitinophaga varians]|uniref:glycosyltransferase family 32 protein n=1 Tax=Chitinophaga varians TaxID=2202339 RepID=UPI00165F584F|nr:glycosyltransferase [Chitinophaga varians]MBC9913412.1 glycoside transferase family 32 [Chitinophaga varians]
MDAIPKVIHLISARQELPPQYAPFIREMRHFHPEWEIKIWDDQAAIAIVSAHFPEWLPDYEAYPRPVQRADILRTMIIYLHGGFYLDLDMHCLKPLDPLSVHSLVLATEKVLSQEQCTLLGHQHTVRIANYMFGGIPRHPFWLHFLQAAQQKARQPVVAESDILETTGPGLLTHVYHQYAGQYNNITLLPNDGGDCPISCGPASCHFGTYAIHMHMGSWRWQTGHSPNLTSHEQRS